MASRKTNTDGIDESLLIASIGKSRTVGSPPVTEDRAGASHKEDPPTATTSRGREAEAKRRRDEDGNPSQRKKQGGEYRDKYFRHNGIKTRQCVYISEEMHRVFSSVVRVITRNGITVGGYIDTVLRIHIEEHKDELNEMYRKAHEDMEFLQ